MNDETFIGPVVQVFVKEPARGGMLENVYLRHMAGRDFLVGTIAPSSPADQRAGCQTWCAMDHVQMLIHFPDLDTARRYWEAAMREWRERETEKKQRRWWQGW